MGGRTEALPAPLRDPFWKDYREWYVADDFYWYQPKGLAITAENLKIIQRRLAFLKNYEGQSWTQQQHAYTRDLARHGLITLTKKASGYEGGDYSALARMNKVIYTTLGLAWVDKGSNVFITPVGHEFMRSGQPQKIVEQQLLKYQFPNPALRDRSGDAGIFPHLFLVQLLQCFPEPELGITKQEFILFVSRAKSNSNLARVREGIERYRLLDHSVKSRLADWLDTIPVLKDGRIQVKGRRTSIYNTIKLNSSYALSFFAFPDYIAHEGDTIRIRRDHWSRVQELALKQASRSYYTAFDNAKDWFSFYGDEKRTGSILDALDYYEKTTKIVEAGQAYSEAKRRGLVKGRETINEYVNLRIKEKMLEDFLELNLHLLEDGLTLVGRQYPTLVGPIDLLARDRSKRYMVIELKKGKASDRVFGQMNRYRGFIQEELSPRKREVRGAIVAQEIDNKLKYAFRGQRSRLLQLFRFEFQGKVDEVPCNP
jgi:hypothetical protein